MLNYDKIVAQRLLLSFNPESIKTASERFPIWSRTLSIWLENPSIILFGVGAFNFSYARLSIGYETAHNDMLTIGSELGLASLLVFVTWLLSMGLLLYRNIKMSDLEEKWRNICIFGIFIGLLFAGQFEATLYPTIGTLPMFRAVISLLLASGLFRYKQAYLER